MLSSYTKLSTGRSGDSEAASDGADAPRDDDQKDGGTVSDEEEEGDVDDDYEEEDDGGGDTGSGPEVDERAMESRDSLWDSETPLPPLANAHDRHSLVELLTTELAANDSNSADGRLPPYLETFEVEIPDNEVVLGAVPVEEVESRERELEDARIRQAQLEAEAYRARETRLAQKEAVVRDRLVQEAQRQHDALVRREKQLAELEALRARRIRVLYQQCEAHLLNVLQQQQAVVRRVYGDFEASRVPESLRRLRVAWRGIPQILAMRVKRLNAVKDKLPRGNYVLVATLYDRLGGHAMHWTNWDPEGPSDRFNNGSQCAKRRRRPNFTRPFHHRGRFFHTDVVVDQRLDIVCPPESARRPANAIIFELFRLSEAAEASDATHKGRRRRAKVMAAVTDAVVAWGVLPMCTPDLALVSGKFKVPMLRGELDATMDKFRDVEHMYARDLSAWLCNLYVQTSVKDELAGFYSPQESGVGGYDVQVDAQRDLYDLRPSRLVENGFGRYVRQASEAPTVSGAKSSEGRAIQRRKKSTNASVDGMTDGCNGVSGRQAEASAATTITTTTEDEHDLDRYLNGHRCSRRRRGDDKWWSPARWLPRGKSNARVYSGDRITPQLPMSLPSPSKQIASIPEEDAASSDGGKRSPRDKFAVTSGVDSDDWIFSSSDELSEGEGVTTATSNRSDEPFDYENYRFSVNSAVATETARHVRFHAQRKMLYLRHELLTDLLGSSSVDKTWRTLEFWRLALLLLVACWVRVYVRSAVQWLFLRARRVPVFDLQPRWVSCLVKYTWRAVPTRTEVSLLAIGVLANDMLFVVLALAAALAQTFVGELPPFGSDLIVCVGLAMLLDPLLVLLVDVASHHYDCSSLAECANGISASSCHCVDGDWFKLYVRFQALEGSGVVGAFMTLALFAALSCASLAAFYMYLLRVHRNGRMLDVYRRVHGLEGDFFVPHDLELSLAELRALVAGTKRWRGPRGAQRKVFVHEYVLTDPLDASFQEKSAHVAIYNVELDGSRQLHRHFLKASDGAVIELFGEVGTGEGGRWGGLDGQGGHESDVAAALAMLYRSLGARGKEEAHTEDKDAALPLSKLLDAV